MKRRKRNLKTTQAAHSRGNELDTVDVSKKAQFQEVLQRHSQRARDSPALREGERSQGITMESSGDGKIRSLQGRKWAMFKFGREGILGSLC